MQTPFEPGNQHTWNTKLLSPEELLSSNALSNADLRHVREAGLVLTPRLDDLIHTFYARLHHTPVYSRYFSDDATLRRVQAAQRTYWNQFFLADVDAVYLERLETLGRTHATIKLPLDAYLSSMNHAFDWMAERLRESDLETDAALAQLRALGKLLHLDISVVVGELHAVYKETISQQARSLVELSTPAMRLWDEVVLLPLVGVIDTARAQQLIETLLHSIVETESRVAILDVTGVPIIDTRVAQHILKTVSAARMLGADVFVTGISPEMAQTMTKLDIRTDQIHTCGTLSAGLQAALSQLGIRIAGKET